MIEKSTSTSREAKRSLDSASGGACVVFGCKTTSALHRAQPRSSREAKGKKPMSAISEATTTSLATKTLTREARVEAPFSVDSEVTLLEGKALLNSAKLAFNSGAKALSAQIASPCGEAIPASPLARRTASKAKFRVKPKTFQLIMANF